MFSVSVVKPSVKSNLGYRPEIFTPVLVLCLSREREKTLLLGKVTLRPEV